jgi:hypothetical protein
LTAIAASLKLKHMSIYSGEDVELPTEQEAEDYWYSAHPNCEVCSKPIAVAGKDGLEFNCTGCDIDQGTAITVDGKIEGYVHDGCREKYTLDLLVEQVEAALRVRLPLGLEPWAAERARNIVDGLRNTIELTLKP